MATLLMVVAAFVAQGNGAAQAATVERTPPYDFGCRDYTPCSPGWEPARNGTLHAAGSPGVGVTYSIPPYPTITQWSFTSSAGVYATTSADSQITLSARVRDLGSVGPPSGHRIGLCLVVWGQSVKIYAEDCAPVPRNVTTTMSTTFGEKSFPPASYMFYVRLTPPTSPWYEPWAAGISVESISYTLGGTVQPPPPPPPPSSDCTITGTSSADTLTGTSGADVICGLGGNDKISGLGGNDTLRGGDGKDTLIGGAGSDSLDGGAGSDTASYSGSSGGVTANLSAAAPQVSSDGTGGSDTLVAVENVTGSNTGNDAITGSSGANLLDGLGGNDNLYGLGGNDTLRGGSGTDGLDGGDGTDKCVDPDANTTRISCES